MSSLAFLSSPFLQTVSCWTGFTWYSCSMIGYHVICLSNRTLLEKSGLRTVKVTEKRVKATLAGKHLETRRWPLVSGLKFNLFQCSCGSHLGTLALGSLLLALKILFSLSSSLDWPGNIFYHTWSAYFLPPFLAWPSCLLGLHASVDFKWMWSKCDLWPMVPF